MCIPFCGHPVWFLPSYFGPNEPTASTVPKSVGWVAVKTAWKWMQRITQDLQSMFWLHCIYSSPPMPWRKYTGLPWIGLVHKQRRSWLEKALPTQAPYSFCNYLVFSWSCWLCWVTPVGQSPLWIPVRASWSVSPICLSLSCIDAKCEHCTVE